MLAKSVKDPAQMSFVLFCVVATNEYIIQINQSEVINVTRHYSIHKLLEHRWCITKPKQKYSVFKQPITSAKCSLFTSIVS